MGQTADQLRQEIDQKRDDAAQKIDQLEARVEGTMHQAQDMVDETVQTVKENIDIRRQIEERPLVALGAALIGGFVLGGALGGDKDGNGRPHHVEGSSTAYSSSRGGQSGLMGTVRNAAQRSGLEDTLSNASSALLGSVTEQLKSTLDRSFPGFSEKVRQASQTQGGFADKSRATSGMSSQTSSPAQTDMSGHPTPQHTSG